MMVWTAGANLVTVTPRFQRSGGGELVENDGCNGLVANRGKTVGQPSENGWQPFSVTLNGKHGREGDLRVPSLSSPLSFLHKEKILLRERVVRLFFEPPTAGLLGFRNFELPAVGLPGLRSN